MEDNIPQHFFSDTLESVCNKFSLTMPDHVQDICTLSGNLVCLSKSSFCNNFDCSIENYPKLCNYLEIHLQRVLYEPKTILKWSNEDLKKMARRNPERLAQAWNCDDINIFHVIHEVLCGLYVDRLMKNQS